MKEEEKNKVGRPKLADAEIKKKSLIMLSVAVLVIIALIAAGYFTVIVGTSTNNLKGSTSDCIMVEKIRKCPSGYKKEKVNGVTKCAKSNLVVKGSGSKKCTATEKANNNCETKKVYTSLIEQCPSGSKKQKGNCYSCGKSSNKTTKKSSSGNSSGSKAATTTVDNFVSVPYYGDLWWHEGEETNTFKVVTTPEVNVEVRSSNDKGIEVVKEGDNTAKGNQWSLKFKKAGKYAIYYINKDNGDKMLTHFYNVRKKNTIKLTSRRVGDVTGDNIVDETDYNLIFKKPTSQAKEWADVNGDGKVNATDARVVARLIDKYDDINGNGRITDTDYKILLNLEIGYGDVNGDGKNNALDTKLLSNYVNKKSGIDNKYLKYADVDLAGGIVAYDVSLQQRYAKYYYDTESIILPVLWMSEANKLKVGQETGQFSISVTDGSDVRLVSSNPKILQVEKLGDNSSKEGWSTAKGNKWSLTAKKAGTCKITAESDTGLKVTYQYKVVK